MPSFFPPVRLASKKRGDTITRYLLFLIKQTEWKIFKCRYLLLYLLLYLLGGTSYLLTLEALPT